MSPESKSGSAAVRAQNKTQSPQSHAASAAQDHAAQTKPAPHAANVSSLASGRVGQEGAIAFADAGNHRELQKLMALGVLPGTYVRLLRKFPAYVFQLGYSQFTVDQQLAAKIQVNWKKSK